MSAPPATDSIGINTKDVSVIPQDMQDNLISIVAQHVGKLKGTNTTDNFSAAVGEYYAVKKTTASVEFMTSKQGKQASTDGSAEKVLEITRQAIAGQNETDTKENLGGKGSIRKRLAGDQLDPNTYEGLNKQLRDTTGLKNLKLAAGAVACTQLLFGYKNDQGKISAQGRIQVVPSALTGGNIVSGSFTMEKNDKGEYIISVTDSSGVMLTSIIKELLSLETEPKFETPVAPVKEESQKVETVDPSANQSVTDPNAVNQGASVSNPGTTGASVSNAGTPGGKKNKSKRKKHLKKRMTKKKHHKVMKKHGKKKRGSKKGGSRT